MTSCQPAETPRNAQHLPFLDGMRAVAALTVLGNHIYAQVWTPSFQKFPPPQLHVLTQFLVIGHLAVSVFIVISGFCLMLPVLRNDGVLPKGAWHFLKRRARRIVPPYYASLLLCLLMIATVIGEPTRTLWDYPIGYTLRDVVAHVILVQNFYATSRISYVFWSIALECQIYLFFPLLVRLTRSHGIFVAVALTLLVGYGLQLGLEGTRIARGYVHFLGLFGLGMLGATIGRGVGEPWERLRERVPWTGLAILFAAITAALSLSWGWEKSVARFPYLDLPAGLTGMCLMVACCRQNPGLPGVIFTWKPLVFIGGFSYSLYLCHAPLLQWIWQTFLMRSTLSDVAQFVVLLGAGGPALIGLAYVFYLAFERPFLNTRRT